MYEFRMFLKNNTRSHILTVVIEEVNTMKVPMDKYESVITNLTILYTYNTLRKNICSIQRKRKKEMASDDTMTCHVECSDWWIIIMACCSLIEES
jgi:hypothetical protein